MPENIHEGLPTSNDKSTRPCSEPDRENTNKENRAFTSPKSGATTHIGVNGRYARGLNEDTFGNPEVVCVQEANLRTRIARAKDGRPFMADESTIKRKEMDIPQTLIRERGALYVISDGGGGGKLPGDLASQIVVEGMIKIFYDEDQASETPPHKRVVKAIKEVHGRVKRVARGSFATLNAVLVHDNKVTIFSVGDSRTYRVDPKGIELLTKDQTLENIGPRDVVQKKLRTIKTLKQTAKKTRNERDKNALQRRISNQERELKSLCSAIGGKAKIQTTTLLYEKGDIYLQVTDGPTDILTKSNLLRIVREDNDPQAISGKIIREANIAKTFRNGELTRGRRDNLTAQVIKLL